MRLKDWKTIEDLGAFTIYQRDVIKELKEERDELKAKNEHLEKIILEDKMDIQTLKRVINGHKKIEALGLNFPVMEGE